MFLHINKTMETIFTKIYNILAQKITSFFVNDIYKNKISIVALEHEICPLTPTIVLHNNINS